MTVVSFHPAADDELQDATEWYLARSAAAAAGFLREIEHALSRIAEAPERYPLTNAFQPSAVRAPQLSV
jgi:plasmid stabilization system protein ParE